MGSSIAQPPVVASMLNICVALVINMATTMFPTIMVAAARVQMPNTIIIEPISSAATYMISKPVSSGHSYWPHLLNTGI